MRRSNFMLCFLWYWYNSASVDGYSLGKTNRPKWTPPIVLKFSNGQEISKWCFVQIFQRGQLYSCFWPRFSKTEWMLSEGWEFSSIWFDFRTRSPHHSFILFILNWLPALRNTTPRSLTIQNAQSTQDKSLQTSAKAKGHQGKAQSTPQHWQRRSQIQKGQSCNKIQEEFPGTGRGGESLIQSFGQSFSVVETQSSVV